MLKKTFFTFILFASLSFPVQAGAVLAEKLSGRILLQVESRGEAWYIRPNDHQKYYLGSPSDAFSLMRTFSLGITNADLKKIPIGLIDYSSVDTDGDGLIDDLEKALLTDENKADTDGDGYDDKTEISSGYSPTTAGRQPLDENFVKNNLGKILLQVESRGECWYVNPADGKRYFLANPIQALTVMGKLGLGITNANLQQIPSGFFYNQVATPSAPAETPAEIPSSPVCLNCQDGGASNPLSSAASAVSSNNVNQATNYFTPSLKPIIEYTMGFLTAAGRLTWSQMLAGSTLLSSTATQKIYHNYVYYQGEKIEIKYRLEKQSSGDWLIANL